MRHLKIPPQESLEVYESRILLGVFGIVGLAFSLVALFILGFGFALFYKLLTAQESSDVLLGIRVVPLTEKDVPVTVIGMIISAGGVILFGIVGIQMMRRLFSATAPVIYLNDEGFKDVRISKHCIPWESILSVKSPYRKASKGFVVEVEPTVAATLGFTFVSRFTRVGNLFFGSNGFWIITATLKGISSSDLFDAVRTRINSGSIMRKAG